MRSRWYVVRGRPMHAFVDEAGPQVGAIEPRWRLPVVLVHGLGVAAESMRKVAGELAIRGHRVYAPDLPGFGRSSAHKPPQPLDVRGQSEALEAWLEEAGIERPALVGNSIGAQAVVDLAARRPDRVSAVVLLGPTTDPEVRSIPGQIWRWLRNSKVDRSAAQGLVPAYLAAGLGRVAATFRYSVRHRIERDLPRLRAPGLVIAGTADPITPPPWTRRVSEMLPDGRIRFIEGAGHSTHGTHPEQVARYVHEFLEELARAERVPATAI